MNKIDLVVVGAGLAGSAATWAAASRGLDVVVLEAFGPGHRNGSSHGSARIFRRVYSDPLYVRMTGRAGELWRRLEDESGEALLTTTGVVDFGAARDPVRLHETLTGCGVRSELLPPEEAQRRWPGFDFTGTGPVLFQREGGGLDPDRAMAAMLRRAAASGAEVHFGTPVTGIQPTAEGVTIRTEAGDFTAPVAVIAAGAWLPSLVSGHVALPPLTVTQEQILHLPPRTPPVGQDPWPAFIYEDETTCFYGLPGGRDTSVPGAVKIGEHHAGKPVTANTRDFAIDPHRRQRILDFARRHLPGLDNSKTRDETTCLYTTTASEDFILDRRGPLVVASACSGHGAKFAPLLGEIIADLAQGRPSPDRRFTLAAHLAAAGAGTAKATRGAHRLPLPRLPADDAALRPGEAGDPGRDDFADGAATAGDGYGGQVSRRVGAERLEDLDGDRGPGARVAVVDLQRRGAAVGQRERVHPFGPGLEQQPRNGDHQPALVTGPAAGPFREFAHRVGDLALGSV
jgi:sarcosine oxidase